MIRYERALAQKESKQGGGISLDEFLSRLTELNATVGLANLKPWMQQLEVTEADLADHIHFSPDTYQRNLVLRTKHFEMLVLCFESGHRTPIHDHAGSACGVKVLRGIGVETGYTYSDGGWLFATGSHALPEGEVVSSMDRDVHQLANLQSSKKRLVTLHVYSPPLGVVGNYSMTDNSVTHVKAEDRKVNVVFPTESGH